MSQISKEELEVYVTLVAAAVACGEVSDAMINDLVGSVNTHRRNQRTVLNAKAVAEGYRCTPDSRVVLHGLAPVMFNGIECTLKVITNGKASVVFDDVIEYGKNGSKKLVRRMTVPVQCVKRAGV